MLRPSVLHKKLSTTPTSLGLRKSLFRGVVSSGLGQGLLSQATLLGCLLVLGLLVASSRAKLCVDAAAGAAEGPAPQLVLGCGLLGLVLAVQAGTSFDPIWSGRRFG